MTEKTNQDEISLTQLGVKRHQQTKCKQVL